MGLVTVASFKREKSDLAEQFRSNRTFESPDRIRFVTAKTFANEGADFCYLPYYGNVKPEIVSNSDAITGMSLIGLPNELIHEMIESANKSKILLLDINDIIYVVPSNSHTNDLPLFGAFTLAGVQAYMVSLLSQANEFYSEYDADCGSTTFSKLLAVPTTANRKVYSAPVTQPRAKEIQPVERERPISKEKAVTINNIYAIFDKEEKSLNTPKYDNWKNRLRSSNY